VIHVRSVPLLKEVFIFFIIAGIVSLLAQEVCDSRRLLSIAACQNLSLGLLNFNAYSWGEKKHIS